ncbi:MAG: hypothetical protein PHR35_22760, partial [Kiritimatiellae bacterium]|nr:hypothetical protein [Kiritimatiellia bacterium]
MERTLVGKTFRHYRSGVYEGKFVPDKTGFQWSGVDPQTRVQLKHIPFEKQMKESLFDFAKLHENLAAYAAQDWRGDNVTLSSGTRYNRYLPLSGTLAGREVTAQLWAQRGQPPLVDVVTLDGHVIAFVAPGRISSEILVLEGHEALTPLTKYNDPLLSKAE